MRLPSGLITTVLSTAGLFHRYSHLWFRQQEMNVFRDQLRMCQSLVGSNGNVAGTYALPRVDQPRFYLLLICFTITAMSISHNKITVGNNIPMIEASLYQNQEIGHLPAHTAFYLLQLCWLQNRLFKSIQRKYSFSESTITTWLISHNDTFGHNRRQITHSSGLPKLSWIFFLHFSYRHLLLTYDLN